MNARRVTPSITGYAASATKCLRSGPADGPRADRAVLEHELATTTSAQRLQQELPG